MDSGIYGILDVTRFTISEFMVFLVSKDLQLWNLVSQDLQCQKLQSRTQGLSLTSDR